jgi:hypothetical protein
MRCAPAQRRAVAGLRPPQRCPGTACYPALVSAATERTWDQRILDAIPSGTDETLIAENLRLTPTERVEKLQRFVDQLAALRAGSR